jgi:2'-5' RNA ligase
MERVVFLQKSGSLRLALDGIGSFRAKRGYTWWVGIKDETEPPQRASRPAAQRATELTTRQHMAPLERLAIALARGLNDEGFSIRERKFKPHITLGRSVVTERPIALRAPEHRFEADRVSLMKSDIKGSQPTYTELASACLG